MNEIVNGHTIQELNYLKSLFIGKINTFNKSLAIIMKKNKDTNHQYLAKKGDINTGSREIKRKIKKFQEQFITILQHKGNKQIS